MTLAPFVDPSVHGVEGKRKLLEPGARCVVPGCLSLAQQRHHVWPRSFLRGQPYEWVHVEGETVCNTVGLCLTHHAWVTGEPGVGHRAHIRWNHNLRILEWWEQTNLGQDMKCLGPLRNQPLVPAQPSQAAVERKLEGLCPTCGRPPRKERPPGPKRKVKTWSISVPDDSETGSDILDTYIEDLGVLMGFEGESSRLLRYHVLVPVLEWVMQNRYEFIREFFGEDSEPFGALSGGGV